MGRPNRLLRWGYGSGATLVEPASGKSAVGYLDGELVPAGWLNTHLHLAGAWLGYLRGPNLGNWTRAAHGSLDPFDADKIHGLAADTTTVDTDLPVYRYAAIGEVTSTPALRVSRRGIGSGWVARALPVMSGEARGVAFVGRWLVWGAAGTELWSTIADDQSGDSAVGTNDATKWAAVGLATGVRVQGAAWCAGATGRAAGARHAVVLGESGPVSSFALLVSTDSGATWASKSVSWAASAYAPDIAYDPTRDVFVVVSGRAAVAVSPSGAPAGTWVQHSGPGILSGGDPFKIRCGGGTWIMVSPTGTGIGTPVAYRSRDAGASWESLTAALPYVPGTTTPVAMYDLAYADGVWVMAVADAPYLYASHDDGDTWERVALPIGEEAAWDIHRVLYADGQLLASGLGFCVASGRAMATADGTLVPDTTPSILSDAYRLRGRLLSQTAPSDGQVYAWSAGTSQWTPVSAAAFTVTTTRGDLIVRGASADERLALGTRGYVLRAGATDPAWSVVAASDSALPTAGADYAGAIYWNTTTGGLYACVYAGATPTWGWRVLDAFRGAIDTTGTPDDTFKVVTSVTLPTNTVALIDIDVVGIKNDHSTGLVARGSAGFITDGTTATELDALTLVVGDPARVRLIGNGLAVDVEIKGVAAEDWTWRARITVRAEVTA